VTTAFEAFFAQAFAIDTEACRAHGYQVAIATERELPELVCVPTGCGKTAAIVLGWLWRRFKHEDAEVRASTPRRLVYCLPMRTLVEQIRSTVITWLTNLEILAGATKRGTGYSPSWEECGVPVFTLMGGEESADWQAYPEREAILVGTQDMLLSRALNRGYGLFPTYWPIDFGAINTDALWVLDEVQLMGVGRTTSAQLQLMASMATDHVRVAARQTIWMSATLGAGSLSLPDSGRGPVAVPAWMRTPDRGEAATTVRLQTLSKDERAAPRNGEEPSPLQVVVHAAKHLELRVAGTRRWTAESPDLVQEVAADAANRLTLIVTNTVARARAVHDAIRAHVAGRSGQEQPDIVLLHSRFRPWDRRRALERIASTVPSAGRIVVSTQVLEAGFDLDGDRLFTEIAPWPSLVQRLGRLNRRGRHRDARVVVFDVPFDDTKAQKLTQKNEREKALEEAQVAAARPYDWQDIQQSREQLGQLGDTLPTLDRLPDVPLPLEGPVLRRFHVEDAFDTDPDLSGGHVDVSAFIRARDRDLDVYVLWRHIGENLDDQPPPHPDEICAVPLYELTQALRGKRGFRLAFGKKRRRKHAWEAVKIGDGRVRVGDTLMLDLDVGCYLEERGWLGAGVGDALQKPSTYIVQHERRRVWLRATPGGVPVVDDIDDRILGYAGRDRDPRSFIRRWMTLDEHLDAAQRRAEEIVADLVSDVMKQRIALAARWHDVGKALERRGQDGDLRRPFQEMLRSAGTPEGDHPADRELYAKSNRRGGKGAGFRHEVASALAYLEFEPSPDDLVAYLIMSHHGKVRLLPEPWDEERMNDANGVRPGDSVPSDGLKGLATVAEPVRCDPAKLIATKSWSSWQQRVVRLLDEHGHFELAYLEALLRVADWRASA
jgi:CRISPR-associated endonuclease/helicase Cas3